MNDLISIVIPVYKVEKYISRCIDSVINQTYRNLEIILIDDGSPDRSGEICDLYASEDYRIKVIHNSNKGVSNARNTGLREAKGKYISFVDSDDYVSERYIEHLYKILIENGADISCCNFEYTYEEQKKNITKKKLRNNKKSENIIIYGKIEALEELLYQKNIDTSVWGKLFKRETFNNVFFPEGKIYEDFGTVYKTMMNSNKIVYSNEKQYYYLQRETSTIGRKFQKEDFDMLELAKEMKKNVTELYPELEGAVESRILDMDFYFLRRMDKKEYLQQYLEIKNDIKKNRKNVYNNNKIKLKTRIAILISYINIDLVKYLYMFSKKIKLFGLDKYLTKYKK